MKQRVWGGSENQVLASFGIVVLMTLMGVNSIAEPSEADFDEIGQQLRQYARNLGDVGEAMRAHAGTTIPEGLDENQEKAFAAERNELLATADAALMLATEIMGRETMANRKTLTRADMASLMEEVDVLSEQISRTMADESFRQLDSSLGYNDRSNELLNIMSKIMHDAQEKLKKIVNNLR
jgi:hypothetical protein